MCEAAVRGALALGYTGAGTFEFVVPPAPAGARDFHLTGVGCRLSPGHPVTELVTGIDLVREQILVSAGFPLSFAQDGIRPRGAAVQCHVRATPGLLTGFAPPGGPFVRVDTHAYAGWRVGTDEGDGYDSPLAKVCAWAPDRERALARVDRALEEFRIAGDGVRTTVESLRTVLADPAFRSPTHLKGRTG
jgi:acetyl-CoA carboxylase biotin carboxylase subunit